MCWRRSVLAVFGLGFFFRALKGSLLWLYMIRALKEWLPMPTEHGIDNPGVGHETTDANAFGVAIFAVGLILLVAVASIASVWIFRYFSRTQSLGAPASPFVTER